VSFLLTIRHNLEAAEDHFGQNEVTRFDGSSVRVGAGASCEQVVQDAAFPELAFTIVVVDAKLEFVPADTPEVFINGDAAGAARELLSGDEIRLGHWTFHIHKTYGEAGDSRRRTGLARLARLLVALVLLAELSIVVWLPRQVRAAAERGNSLSKLRTFALLDSLRRQIAAADDKGEEIDQIGLSARRAIGRDLDRRARYLRRYRDSLSSEQCLRMYRELETLATALDHLGTAGLLQPIPDVAVEAAVKAALRAANEKGYTP